MNMIRLFIFILALIPRQAWSYEINDGHLHYNQDVWDQLSPQQALRLMSENGINRAIVSSTPAAGTIKLYQLSKQRIIPFIRPYRVFRDRFTWHSDPAIIDYIRQQLATGIYQGFGEFHLFKAHKDTVVVKTLMKMMVDADLVVSAHADAETIEHLMKLQPELRLIWAHCGMDHPVDDVKRIMNANPGIKCDLSFRYNMLDDNQKLLADWRSLLEQYPKRFMLGMDTYIPRRWAELPQHIDYAKHWLDQLSSDTKHLIAGENIMHMFPLED
ncbi:MAG: amidohydrolase [Gammaproteobacteria bacterium]|nr:amidohydrolase [Gammaproteobacteria bacterium]